MKFIVLGSPGVGKGTYTQDLVKQLSILHISTGDLFRENIKQGTALGQEAKKIIAEGKLCPDELTIAMVKERLSRGDIAAGFILDGFPRTIPQAEALQNITQIDFALNITADHDVIMQRLSGRIICRKCGRIYHKVNVPTKVAGKCDLCDGEIYQRDDDTPEAVEKRLKLYEQQTAPLIQWYRDRNMLREIAVNEEYGIHGKEIIERLLKVIKG
jgi:adenylate kinase